MLLSGYKPLNLLKKLNLKDKIPYQWIIFRIGHKKMVASCPEAPEGYFYFNSIV